MAKLTDKIFGDFQKERLRKRGVTENDDIDILIIDHYGGKMVKVNGQTFCI